MNNDFSFDITVVGAGHAGLEAAHIAESFGLNVCLVTMAGVPIASTPCNPSIGGVGKGQVVREIDALGGAMGKLADLSAIQCRILNESKGPAVMSTRYQVDKDLYSKNATILLKSLEHLTVIYDKIVSVTRNGDKFLLTGSNQTISTNKLIITTGTFLNGLTHIGATKKVGGRIDCEKSDSLTAMFKDSNLSTMRFKTGTPPRLDSSTVDYSKLVAQGSDQSTQTFHFKHNVDQRFAKQVSCYIAHTNPKTLSIIRNAKESSPLFNGQINGVGPRYCPSIEDKAFRYLDRDIHHVFVEPEGLSNHSMYPNGLSTSLPEDIQKSFINSIEGLENAKIIVSGYAVEYDVIDTTQLDIALHLDTIPGLYFAGQINGTSGYEEAAAQGLIAGINASHALLSREAFVLNRTDSYIGVMIEDLITNKRDEPYRLFTARSENRLYIREDNTIERIAPYRALLGLNKHIDRFQSKYINDLYLIENLLASTTEISDSLKSRFNIDGNYKTIFELLKNAKLDIVQFLHDFLLENGLIFNPRIVRNIAINTKYKGYIQRSEREIMKQKKLLNKNIDYKELLTSTNISFECRQRIKDVKPSNFSQLKNIKGIRPATLAYVAGRYK